MGPLAAVNIDGRLRDITSPSDVMRFAADRFPSEPDSQPLNENCYWVGNTRRIGGSTKGALRKFAVRVRPFELYPEAQDAITAATGMNVTQRIVLSAFCNRSIDHRILCELAAFLSCQYDGYVDFLDTAVPSDAPGALDLYYRYGDQGAVIDTRLGTAETCRWWLGHDHFHMAK